MRLNFHIFPRKFNIKHPHGFRGTSYQRQNANWHEIGPEVWKKKNNYCLRRSDSLVSYPDLSQRRSVDQWLKLIFERTNFKTFSIPSYNTNTFSRKSYTRNWKIANNGLLFNLTSSSQISWFAGEEEREKKAIFSSCSYSRAWISFLMFASVLLKKKNCFISCIRKRCDPTTISNS